MIGEGQRTYSESVSHLSRALLHLVHGEVAHLELILGVSSVVLGLQVGSLLIRSLLLFFNQLVEPVYQFCELWVHEMVLSGL